MGWHSATFRDNGTEVSSLSRDKGTTGKAKNLTKRRDGPGQSKFGPGRAGTAKIRDGTGRDSQNSGRDGLGRPKSGTGRGTKRDRAEEDVLKQEKDVHNQHVKAPVPIGLNCLHFARA